MRLVEASDLTTSLRHIDASETKPDAVQVFLQDKNDEGERTWTLLASILTLFFDTRKLRTSQAPVATSQHSVGARNRLSTRQTRSLCSSRMDACLWSLLTPAGKRAPKGIGPTRSCLACSTSPVATANGAAANREFRPKDAKHMHSRTRTMESPAGGVMLAGLTRQVHAPQVATLRLGEPKSQQSSPSLFLSHMANITPNERDSDPSNSSDALTRRHSEPAKWSSCTSSMDSVPPLAPSLNPQLMRVEHSNASQCGGRHRL